VTGGPLELTSEAGPPADADLEAALLAAALDAAARGREVLRDAWGQARHATVEHKAEFDFVTEVDRAAEAAILAVLRARAPELGVLAEESGASAGGGTSEYTWIVDPLDGTTNFIHRVPSVAISIAAVHGRTPVVGVVDTPLLGETFSGRRGAGVSCNGTPLAVSTATRPDQSLLATGFPFRQKEVLPRYLESFDRMFARARGIRRLGSAALDLAYVAAGRFDAFWELGLSRWDIAAGVLLVREAGGEISGFGADDDFWSTGNILASNGRLHAGLRAELDAVFPPPES